MAGTTVSANEVTEQVTAEKVWSVEFNTPVLNEKMNLEKITVVDNDGVEIPTIKEVNDLNANIVEILPVEPYAKGEYSIQIPADLKAKYNFDLNTDVTKKFEVTYALTTADLKGKWESLYVHDKALLGIKAQFLTEGISNVEISRSGMQFKGIASYKIEDGMMEMKAEIDNKNVMNVEGKMYIYNAKLFKIVSSGGKEAYFSKK